MAVPGIGGVGAVGTGGIGAPGVLTPDSSTSRPSSSGSFSQLLSDQLRRIESQQQQADNALQQLVEGKTDNVQDVVISIAEADLTFKFAMELRNRLLESYQEIMRMQV